MANHALTIFIKQSMSMNEFQNEIGEREPGAFNINKCYLCPLTVRETELKRCGGCFKISYCSQAHQKKHWKDHKDYCKVIQKVEKILPEGKWKNREDFNKYRDIKSSLCIRKMTREINGHEISMIQFADRCEICYRKNSRIVCHICLSANYCSKEHMDLDSKHHSKLCDDYKLMTDVELYAEIDPSPLFSLRKGTLTLSENIKEFIESSIKIPIIIPGILDLDIALISRKISHPLSLLWGLKCIDYKIPDKLIIHLVGSAAAETSKLLQWEIIPHIYPNIKKLTIVFIGPDIQQPDDCILCKTCKKTIKIELHNDLYHNYVKSNIYQKPDIVCAFHCGFHRQYSEWQPSLRFLIENAPFIMSSFCELEADMDKKIVLNVKPDMSVQSKRNPFSGLSPFGKSYDDQLDYVNKIITVFCNTSKG